MATSHVVTPDRVIAERMAEAALDFLAALAPEQRAKAALNFEDEAERTAWFYTPGERGGLPLGEMEPPEQRLAHRLIASGLSRGGYVIASTIIGLENTLDSLQGFPDAPHIGRAHVPSRNRDPGMYFVTVFGEPGAQRWGWRAGGHHVCLHYTLVDGRLTSPTPTFFGSNPTEVSFVGPGVLRPLAGEEDLARELLHALDAEQRAVAVISTAAPRDIVQSNRPYIEESALPRELWQTFPGTLSEELIAPRHAADLREREKLGFTDAHFDLIRYTSTPKGLPAARMTPAQREVLVALIRQYIGRMPDEYAEIEAAKFAGDRLEAVHFAWAGGAERKQPHYYRLQAPRFLVEYDNTQNNVDHIHSVWRDPDGDFGRDVLSEHYAREHASG